ncbi:MAG: hypothetical protein WCG78_07980 [Candidatus Omnitrophota bacterium]
MMKTYGIAAAFLAVMIAVPPVSSAATVGNASSTDIPRGTGIFNLKRDRDLSVKAGGDLEFILERKISADAASGAKISRGQWYMSKISYGFLNDRIEPYVKLGTAHFKSQWNEAGASAQLESNTGFAWGLGAKALIFDFKQPRLKFIGDVQYRTADLDVDKGTRNGVASAIDKSRSRFTIREWQATLLAQTEIDFARAGKEEVLGVSALAPYVGVGYSDMNGRMRLTQQNGVFCNPGQISSKNKVGLIVGCDVMGVDAVSLNLEGRFIDETAFSGGLDVLF